LSKRRIATDINYKCAIDRINEDVVLTDETINDDYVTQYRKQRSMLIDALSFAGIPSLRFNGWEGDDLMYILSKLSKDSVVLTDDKDMLQLVSETCKVYRPMHEQLYDVQKLLSDYNLNTVYEFVINKAIIGDESDNIPGCCKGVSSGTSNNIVKILNICNERGLSFNDLIHSTYDLKAFCKNNDIKFFKSYTNFDLQRFKTNMELIDLKRVDKDITDEIVMSIISNVSNCQNNISYLGFMQKLGEYDVLDINSDELVMNVKLRVKNLLL
jgi:5'-3' exonuclease